MSEFINSYAITNALKDTNGSYSEYEERIAAELASLRAEVEQWKQNCRVLNKTGDDLRATIAAQAAALDQAAIIKEDANGSYSADDERVATESAAIAALRTDLRTAKTQIIAQNVALEQARSIILDTAYACNDDRANSWLAAHPAQDKVQP